MVTYDRVMQYQRRSPPTAQVRHVYQISAPIAVHIKGL